MFKTHLKSHTLGTAIPIIFIILLSCGGIASTQQPVLQFSPAIQVRTFYPGADIATVLSSVAPALNDSIFQHVENMDYMSYTASSDGSFIITVYFKPGTNLDLPALNISNIVAVATRQLPSQVVQTGVTVRKQNEPIVMSVDLYAENDGPYDRAFLTNYAAHNLVSKMQQISGVSHLITAENKDSLMRFWLNKGRMGTFNLTLQDVLAAIPAKKLEAVTGVLYKNSKQPFDYIIKCKNEHQQLTEYQNMTIHTNADTLLKLKDVAGKVELGPYTDGNFTRINGKPGVSLLVMSQADSKYNEIQAAVKKLMETASTNFPTGIKYSILYAPKDSIYVSVE